MKPLYIFDLDGTLALIDHRRPILDLDDENKLNTFYLACRSDVPNTPVIETMHPLQRSGADIWIWSGRSDIAQAHTLEWLALYTEWDALQSYRRLHDNGGCTMPWEPEFRMRHGKDYSSDEVLKFDWLQKMRFSDRQRLVSVFDVGDKSVDMWRKCGVPCFQVAKGGF